MHSYPYPRSNLWSLHRSNINFVEAILYSRIYNQYTISQVPWSIHRAMVQLWSLSFYCLVDYLEAEFCRCNISPVHGHWTGKLRIVFRAQAFNFLFSFIFYDVLYNDIVQYSAIYIPYLWGELRDLALYFFNTRAIILELESTSIDKKNIPGGHNFCTFHVIYGHLKVNFKDHFLE